MTTETDTLATPQKKKKITFKEMPGFDISSQAMLTIIDPVSAVVRKGGNAFPALEMMTINLCGNEISVRGVDLQSAQIVSLGKADEIYGDISVAVPASQLNSLIRGMKGDENIRFRYDSDEKRFIIKASKSTYKLPVFIGDMPFIQESDLKPEFDMSFPLNLFAQNLQRIIHCAAHKDVRFYMNGIYLSVASNMFYMVATDGHRMSVTKNEIMFSDSPVDDCKLPVCPKMLKGEKIGMILPIGACPVLQKVLKSQKGDFRMEYCSAHVIFHFDTIRLICNLVEGNYPRWDSIAGGIKKTTNSFSTSMIALKNSASRAISLLLSASTKKAGQEVCVLTFTDDQIRISSPASHAVECEELVEAKRHEGTDESVVGLNGVYLLDAINACMAVEGDDLKIHTSDASAAVYFSCGDTLDIIMPMRI